MMYERFHIIFHICTMRRCDFMILVNNRTRMFPQPAYALPDNSVGLTHFLNTHQVTVIAVTGDAHRN